MNKKKMTHASYQRTYGQLLDYIKLVNSVALPQLEGLCNAWFPGGRRQGHEYLALNPHRNDTRLGSFCINLRTGFWADFASDDRGRDPVSLYAFNERCKPFEAARRLGHILGVAQ